MAQDTQVSATIYATTRERLDQFAEQRGMKKNYVVEQALLYYMAARRDAPDEALIPTRLVLDDAGFDALVAALDAPVAPTHALRRLMRG